MINYRTEEEIDILKQNALIVSKTLAEVAKHIEPGVQLLKLDKIAEEFIRDNGAEPGFKGFHGFPNTLCLSVNEVVVHGIPKKNDVLCDGDIISVDCGTRLNGYYGDSAYTFGVGNVDEEKKLLMQRTKESLFNAIEQVSLGKRIGDVGFSVQNYVESFGYSVVRELVGHGIGRNMHESPEVPNYGKRGSGAAIKVGMVICIEPMINIGTRHIIQERDGWTIRTADNKPSAHYELTVAVRKDKTETLSTYSFIEEVLKQKNIV